MTKIKLKDYDLDSKEVVGYDSNNPILFYIQMFFFVACVAFAGLAAGYAGYNQTYVILFIILMILSTAMLLVSMLTPPFKRLGERKTPVVRIAYNQEKDRIVLVFRNGKVTETYAKTITKIKYSDTHGKLVNHMFAGKVIRQTIETEKNADGSGSMSFRYIDNKLVKRKFSVHVDYVEEVVRHLGRIVREAKARDNENKQ